MTRQGLIGECSRKVRACKKCSSTCKHCKCSCDGMCPTEAMRQGHVAKEKAYHCCTCCQNYLKQATVVEVKMRKKCQLIVNHGEDDSEFTVAFSRNDNITTCKKRRSR